MSDSHEPAGDVAKVTVGFLHPGHYAACFSESLLDLMLYDATNHGRMMHQFGKLAKECHANGIVDGRNALAKAMCDDTGSDWLFMVDSDMGFAGNIVEELISVADPVERPVVGALCFGQKTSGRKPFFGINFVAQPTIYQFAENEQRVGVVPINDYPRDSFIKADATGGACLLIHRSVFERMRETYGDQWFTPATVPQGPTTFSEDLSFCLRLKFMEIPLHIHTAIKTTHDKGGVFLDEEYFDWQQARTTDDDDDARDAG